jgi:putative IMPACT (imprinted ancient) family translation regulator
MKKLNESYFEIKKSKFYGFSYEVNNEEEINKILDSLRNEHKKAKHVVYAYKINEIMKKSDDKEPSNSAGKPLYDLINYKNLNNILIVVIRYFGGTLLGKGLLTRSYMNTASKLF